MQVFLYGVGVKAADIENPVQHDHETDHEEGGDTHSEDEAGDNHEEGMDSSGATSFNVTDNGNWTWEI